MKTINALTLAVAAIAAYACSTEGQLRTETLLEEGWKFHKGEETGWSTDGVASAQSPAAEDFDASSWEEVTVPHDWAIYGPFDEGNDLQTVMVTQNGETVPTKHQGRTGSLPYVGIGWYRTSFDAPKDKCVTLLFDGAMSDARVYVNGQEVAYWPYGYNSFWCDVTATVRPGKANTLAVRLENLPESSRWYPGAGLFRNVHLIVTDPVHVPVWGTHITTPEVSEEAATVRVVTSVAGASEATVRTTILAPDGSVAASGEATCNASEATQELSMANPSLWSPETPNLYTCKSEIIVDGRVRDEYATTFGVRKIEFIAHEGFFLNGKPRKFKGVCLHHDLGPIGAAVNESAIRHQLELLKDMGCDAIRTSHNMPAPELVRLCDEMGLMMMLEPFDEWDVAKCRNGYHRLFAEWAERDMVNMLHQFRNSPSVAMWSIGNEVPTQCAPDGATVAAFLRDICHREDPTRPVTAGMDQVDCILGNGFGEAIDIPGLNYRTFRYLEAYDKLPYGFVLGSETGSTVSSRGVYKLPAEKRFGATYDDHQCSSYDEEACWWSNVPDIDFALADDYPWTLGQFVWTGFDYLGEPSPYDINAWPNHSSMFGIIDLASIPKDRFWLFRSVWNTESPTLHVLPHWNWEAPEDGLEVPVYVYTSWPEAELFVNGVSQGRLRKSPASTKTLGGQREELEARYRLMWRDVAYEPGELKVIAYSDDGKAQDSTFVRTAGSPDHISLTVSRVEDGSDPFSWQPQASSPASMGADGKELLYVTASVVDKDGNLCPQAAELLSFEVNGAARFRAAANGDPTCTELFHEPRMHTFSGRLTVLVQASGKAGRATLTVSGDGLGSASLPITVR